MLWLVMMASALVTVSPTKIKARRESSYSRKQTVSDDEVIDVLEDMMRSPVFEKPNYKRTFDVPLNIPECKTDQCTKQSLNMSRMMDKSADPCDDFYQYACGGWIAEGLPDDHAKWTVFAYLTEQTENLLRRVFEEQKDSADNSVGKLVYNWYASCTNQRERDILGSDPLVNLIHKTVGAKFSPFVPNDFDDPDWILEDVLATVHRSLGVFPLFTVSLSIDPRNASSPTRLSIGHSEPLLKSRDVYLSQEQHARNVARAYLKLMAILTKLLGGLEHQDPIPLVDEIRQICLLEVKVVKATQAGGEESEQSLNKWTVKDFQKKLPEFNWKRYFSKLTEGLGNKTFSDSEEVYVVAPKFFEELMKVLKGTERGIIANYITWFIMHEYAPYLSSDFHEAYMMFSREAYGIQKSSPLWRRCVRGTDSSLDMGVAMLFINGSGFTNESIGHANAMVQNIRAALLENLKTVTWMDSITREAAKEKAEAIFQQIGYPNFITNQTLLLEYFSGLKADPKRLFENRLKETDLRMKNTLLSRGKPMNRFQWDMRPTEINAYFSPTSNKIVVPAGILRPPFYHVQYPHALNFGALGFVVGHELTHGFDVNGAMFDKNGNLANWWSKKSLINFIEREKCFVDEYSKFKVQGHPLDGKKTLGENTADNGGLKLAYMAYQKWLATKDHDTILPNMKLTSHQLFFLSFAQIWCEKATPSYALTDLATNVHSPGKCRVEMTLRNNVDFAKAFNCNERGSKMNPKRKCEVW